MKKCFEILAICADIITIVTFIVWLVSLPPLDASASVVAFVALKHIAL